MTVSMLKTPFNLSHIPEPDDKKSTLSHLWILHSIALIPNNDMPCHEVCRQHCQSLFSCFLQGTNTFSTSSVPNTNTDVTSLLGHQWPIVIKSFNKSLKSISSHLSISALYELSKTNQSQKYFVLSSHHYETSRCPVHMPSHFPLIFTQL